MESFFSTVKIELADRLARVSEAKKVYRRVLTGKRLSVRHRPSAVPRLALAAAW